MKTLSFLVSLGPVIGWLALISGIIGLFVWYGMFELASQLEGDSKPGWKFYAFGAGAGSLTVIGFLNVF